MHVADTSVATGVPSLPTPLGVFSVIQKQVFHRSNIYSNAPMPFMQRITWSGVAMHEGEGIGHRASHGCIRMPHDFAVRLYHLTKLGVPVIVARQELKPVEFADPHLFVHRDKAPEPASPAAPADSEADAGLRGSAGGTRAACRHRHSANDDGRCREIRSPRQRRGAHPQNRDRRQRRDVARVGRDPRDPCRLPPCRIRRAPTAAPLDPTVPMPPAEPPASIKTAPASKAPIAIFISRKEKKIYVRQDFAPLFQAPVTIADPDKPVGTLAFTALDFAGDDRTTLRWNVVSSRPSRRRRRNGKPSARCATTVCARPALCRGTSKSRRSAAAADARRGARPHHHPASGDRLYFPAYRSRLHADRFGPRSRRRNRRRHEFHRRAALNAAASRPPAAAAFGAADRHSNDIRPVIW